MKKLLKLFIALMPIACGTKTEKKQPENLKATEKMELFKAGKNEVTFESEGIELVGNLYLPPDYEEGKSYPGIIVGGSWTTVKEQMAGLYAEKLAEEGYIALAFDHRYYGESGGKPRFVELPSAKSEDFMNALKYLQSLKVVQANKIGGMGVCASGGYMADAIVQEAAFQSFAAVVPWFNTDQVVNAFYGGDEGIRDRIEKSRKANENYQNSGEMQFIPTISDEDPNAAMFGPFEYYLKENLGKVPNWSHDKFALASWEPWLTYRPVEAAKQITIPTLIITSENAATPASVQEFYDNLKGEKELVWMEGGQLDFYHKPELVDESVKLIGKHFKKML
ncbi:MAG: dienelactone hydrolase family protein [Bacteroidota bacterium]